MPVILHKAYLFHLCKKKDIYPALPEKASVSNGEEGEWNLEFMSQTSCLGGDFVIDNHKMTTPKISKSAKNTGFLLSNCFNRKTDRDNVKSN